LAYVFIKHTHDFDKNAHNLFKYAYGGLMSVMKQNRRRVFSDGIFILMELKESIFAIIHNQLTN